MTQDFVARHASGRPITEVLARDEMKPLMDGYALAKRAGRVVSGVLRPFRINIDFSDPAFCRVEERKLILLVESAVQQNRIRQLTPRLCAAVAASGLPITAVDVHIIPKMPDLPTGIDLPRIDRQPSAVGAAAISNILNDIEDPELRSTMEKLRDILKPDEEDRRARLEEKFGRESLELSMERMRLVTHIADLTHGINAARIPTEEESRDYPRLEAERRRKLAQQTEQIDRRRIAQRAVARIDERLDAINEALKLLPHDTLAAEATLLPKEVPEATPTEKAPRVSAAAAAAIASLAAKTDSIPLKRTLSNQLETLVPDSQHFAPSLTADIKHELQRLESLDAPTIPQAIRITTLHESLETLRTHPEVARDLAMRLYGRGIGDETPEPISTAPRRISLDERFGRECVQLSEERQTLMRRIAVFDVDIKRAEASILPDAKTTVAKLLNNRRLATFELQNVEARLEAINRGLTELAADPIAAMAELFPSDDTETPEPAPRRRVSAAAAAAVESLSRGTESLHMRKVLREQLATLTPDASHYEEALQADIDRELDRLCRLNSPTIEDEARLVSLAQAAQLLESHPDKAKAVAAMLYGKGAEDIPEAPIAVPMGKKRVSLTERFGAERDALLKKRSVLTEQMEDLPEERRGRYKREVARIDARLADIEKGLSLLSTKPTVAMGLLFPGTDA